VDIIKRQPVITVGVIVSAIVALIKVTNAFGLTAITQEQQDALTAAVIAMWPVLLVIWALVTPAAAPRLQEGTPVRLPDGTEGVVDRI
jgi:hypothetical protein